VNTGRIVPDEYLNAKATGAQLLAHARGRLNEVATTLSRDISRVDDRYHFSVTPFGGASPHALSSLGLQLNYEPNPSAYSQATSLLLNAGGKRSEIMIAVHGVGATYKGLIAAVAYFSEDPARPTPVCEDVFRVTWLESVDEVLPRFSPWLEKCLINGLAVWRRTLV
jgi:hypothetical protein